MLQFLCHNKLVGVQDAIEQAWLSLWKRLLPLPIAIVQWFHDLWLTAILGGREGGSERWGYSGSNTGSALVGVHIVGLPSQVPPMLFWLPNSLYLGMQDWVVSMWINRPIVEWQCLYRKLASLQTLACLNALKWWHFAVQAWSIMTRRKHYQSLIGIVSLNNGLKYGFGSFCQWLNLKQTSEASSVTVLTVLMRARFCILF